MIAPFRDRLIRFATVTLVATFLVAGGTFAAHAILNPAGPRLVPAVAELGWADDRRRRRPR